VIAWAAVDVLEGRAVRLREGRREAATDHGPASEAIERWAGEGLRALHLVDLGAAFGARPCLEPIVREAKRRWPRLVVQAGGGLRTAASAAELAGSGADRVVVGSLLFADPRGAASLVAALGPERCVAALDARAERVRVAGWREDSGLAVVEAAARALEVGVTQALVTDIARDGMMTGPNLGLYRSLGGVGLSLTASGGIRSCADLEAVAALPDVTGAVVGVALYEGRITPVQMARWGVS